jgi:oxygen-independent coproporphyrinogen-3 oxidase
VPVSDDLLSKYNVPVPRYTSYPTVPYWQDNIDNQKWLDVFRRDFNATNREKGMSLYLHLPFCESLCTYCGCNKKITSNHNSEDIYIAALQKEWAMYKAHMDSKPVIRELHLGGGTPTFFAPSNLNKLLQPILNESVIHPDHEFSFEGHPNNTTREHLQTLYDLGFRRVSYGVQDNDPEVQRIINRIQPLEHVQRATETARAIGYTSVNFDLIYGLPRQTATSIKKTITETIALRPDRIAFYSYAHVPWTSRGQRLFDENDLPDAGEKLALYKTGRALLLDSGYIDIGMDHFALPTDALCIAHSHGTLHRNFMGYTTQHTDLLLGLGVSAISTTKGAYVQNDKSLHNYYAATNEQTSPVTKGCFRNDEDHRFGKYILDIICTGTATYADIDAQLVEKYTLPLLQDPLVDGLISIKERSISVTPMGRNFIRNICSAFDLSLARKQNKITAPLFSKAV